MFPADFLISERVSYCNPAASKKRILEAVGKLLASTSPGLTQDLVFDKLLERERLGSTGLGHGIALPHARMPGIKQAYGAFLQLENSADFDAIDRQPVDLVFGLLVPEEATQEHLQLLAMLASLFSKETFCQELRKAGDYSQLLQLFVQQDLLQQSA
ncbi:MAG: PTS sugar transporter subunit IIA [Candidatus Sedimenticola sp. (ex Thyasira tokunagai)]